MCLKQLAINGHDLQRLGVPPGPHPGELLMQFLHQVLDDPSTNTREVLLSLPNKIAAGMLDSRQANLLQEHKRDVIREPVAASCERRLCRTLFPPLP